VLGYLASQQVKVQGSLMSQSAPEAPIVQEQQNSAPAPTPAIPEDLPAAPASKGSEVPEVPSN